MYQKLFTPPTTRWFEESFPGPTEAQERGWPAIAAGEHTLIHAPTGSGKTLAAFLYTLDRLFVEPVPASGERCRVLYISPMKALAHDVERNLRAPLTGITHAAARHGLPTPTRIRSAIRTGDTPPVERRRMQRKPPDILITTPESLFLLLTSAARSILASVRWVILDEVHAIAGSKRGTHLSLSLERLEEVTQASPVRIGLSATQQPLSTIAAFMGGGTLEGERWVPRPVTVVDVPSRQGLDLEIVVPVEDMAAPAPPDPLTSESTDPGYRSIWPSVYPAIHDLIRSHRSTIVFANSRRLSERICAELNSLAGTEIARAHHGSVSREKRLEIENLLKGGQLPAVVATSTLELGIDMGAVDLVIQIESPTSVTSGLQRVGRAGHQVGATSVSKVFPKFRGDLLEATVVADLMLARSVEPTSVPRSPLDVLAQQVVAAVAMDEWKADDLLSLVRRAAPYRELAPGSFEAVLDMLAGRYPSELFGELRPRIVWDRVTGNLTPRSGAQRLAVTNAGTIPDRGQYSVNLPDGGRVGELDEEMVYECRPGDVFLLGSSTWRISDITVDRVTVVPAPGEPARMPFWRGDQEGRPVVTGVAIGRFVRKFGSMDADLAAETLVKEHHLDTRAAKNLASYLAEQKAATGTLPSDRTVVVERFRDEIGDWRIAILSPLGGRVHAPWAIAITKKLRHRYERNFDVVWSDDGISFRFVDTDDLPDLDDILLEPEDLEDILIEELSKTAIFAARFREAAARALLLPRRRPAGRTPLWLQRRRAADLMAIVTRFGTFPIVLETYREILSDVFDLDATRRVLDDIRARRVRVVEAETHSGSPFASSLVFRFVASFLYEGDAVPAERRAAALTLDRHALQELLGEGELRELLDEEALLSIESELQRLAPDRRARGLDGLHDLLRWLGPLTEEAVDARSVGPGVESLQQLERSRRAIRVVMGGKERWAAIEDAGRLRDALGIQPPPGVPDAFLESGPEALSEVVERYARTHGPFTTGEAVAAVGLPPAVMRGALQSLERKGTLLRGAFRPGGNSKEWVNADVLRRLKRRSLARLRSEIEAVSPQTFARFLPAWQGVGRTGSRGLPALVETIRGLQGVAVPSSILERDVLSCRLDYTPTMLDQLMVSGEVVWIGRGSIGPRDGRIALYLRDQLPLLHRPPDDIPDSRLSEAVLGHLAQRGASFFRDVHLAAGGGPIQDTLETLWDLVWAGWITNDTLAPVRALQLRRAKRSRRASLRRQMLSSLPASSSGRWYLVEDLCASKPSDAEWGTAWTRLLLDRYGILTRGAARAEGIPGGLSVLYPILNRLEETSQIRRGYFVEGQGGLQFAVPGAVERLRTMGEERGVEILAAADPANPYGVVLPWPEEVGARASRSAGAYVVLADGSPLLFLERGGRRAVVFADDSDLLASAAGALAEIGNRRQRLTVNTINGEPASDHPLGLLLLAADFRISPKGVAYRGSPTRTPSPR